MADADVGARIARWRRRRGISQVALAGRVDNLRWTAFGPTNVALHRVAVAVELGDAPAALAAAGVLDVERFGPALRSRRAQVGLDVAWAHTCRRQDAARSDPHPRTGRTDVRVDVHARRCHGSVLDPLVVLIRSQPGMAERLLAEHADDGSGRCRTCSTGAQTGRYRWPCTIHRCAGDARERQGPDDQVRL